MKPTFYKSIGKFQIIIPAKRTGTGKRQRKFFDSEKEAWAEIKKINQNGGAQSVVTDSQQAALLLAKQLGITENQILDAVKHYQKTVLSLSKPSKSLEETCNAYYADLKERGRHRVTLSKHRSTLNRFQQDVGGHLLMIEVTEEMITKVYFKRFKPGVTRKTQWANLHAFFNWAKKNGYIAEHPLANAESEDTWRANKKILEIESFRQILFACAEKYPRLLPYFVLGGLAGVRRCEMISSTSAENDPRIEWSDIDWKQNKIRVRHAVAKETKAVDRRRTIPLEPSAKDWLQLVTKREGPILAMSQSTLQREKEALLDQLGLKVPENCLRNSYASYAASFRGLGDVARAMGDLEQTVKKEYVDLVDDPELGRAWFDIRPDLQARKIVPMGAMADLAV